MASEHGRRLDVRDGVGVLALVAVSLVLGECAVVLRPDSVYTTTFLVGDAGAATWVTSRLVHGARLYRDVAYQYGPLSAYAPAAWAALFGTTLRATVAWYQATSALAVALTYVVLCRRVSRSTALVVTGLGALPLLQRPAGLLDTSVVFSPVVPLERLAMLATLLAWAPATARSRRRAVALGVALGLWQWVKFGGALFALAAVFAVDGVTLATRRPFRDVGRSARAAATTLGVLAAFELAQVAWAFAALPPEIARDAVWPSYVRFAYGAFATGAPIELLHFLAGVIVAGPWSARVVALHMTVLLAATVVAVAHHVAMIVRGDGREGGRDARRGVLFVPLAFAVLASGTYLVLATQQVAWWWVLVMPAAALVEDGGRRMRAAFALLAVPAIYPVCQLLLGALPADGFPVVVADGETVYVEASAADGFAAVADATRPRDGAIRPFLIFASPGATAAGMHAAFDIPLGLRAYWYLPGFVRPYDEAEIARRLPEMGGVVVRAGFTPPRPEPCAWLLPGVFSPPFCALFGRALVAPPRHLGADWWMFAIAGYGPHGGTPPGRPALRSP